MKREHNTIYLLKQTELTFEKVSNEILKPYALTHAQFKIIKYLYTVEGQTVIQKDIEQYFRMSSVTVARLLVNLEKNDWIVRTQSERDKRQNLIRLTEKAKHLKVEFETVSDQLESRLTGRLDATELEELRSLLRKMLAIDLDE